MMKVTHNLTPNELRDASAMERQYETNQQILKCAALLRHRRITGGLDPVFSQLGVGEETQTFKTAVHKIYQRNGLVLHEFVGASFAA